MEYKATLDWTSRIITTFITLLFIGLSIFSITKITDSDVDLMAKVILGVITGLMLSAYVICFLYRPIKYIVDNGNVIIKRPLNDKIIRIKDLKDAFIADHESMKWTIRTFGNGGLFGYFGQFSNQTFGTMTWYATKRKDYLILKTANRHKIVLTPDNKDMVKEIKSQLK